VAEGQAEDTGVSVRLPTADEPATVICGDALEVLRHIAAGEVAHVVTDPPFGVRDEKWDLLDDSSIGRFTMAWASAVTTQTATVFHPVRYAGLFTAVFGALFPRIRPLVWDKPLGSQYAGAAKDGMWFAYESVIYASHGSRDDGAKVAGLIRRAREAAGLSRGAVEQAVIGRRTGLCYRWEEGSCLPSGNHARVLSELLGLNGELEKAIQGAGRGEVPRWRDVFSYPTVTDGDHPCEKPIRLMVDLIEATTEPGAIVLDPFMGSGTTGVACVITGRRFVGIEKDAGHFATARKRIWDAQGVGGLFESKPAAAELFT
jgi:hypothetical protein